MNSSKINLLIPNKNNIKTSNNKSSKLKRKFKELFGDDCDETNISTLESTSSNPNVNKFLTTTVNVNIYNSPNSHCEAENIVIRDKSVEKLSSHDPTNKRLRIDVSMSNEPTQLHSSNKLLSRSLDSNNINKERKSSKTQSGKICNTSKSIQKHLSIRDSNLSSLKLNEEDDPSVKEIWSILGMEAPMVRSDRIKSVPQNTQSTAHEVLIENHEEGEASLLSNRSENVLDTISLSDDDSNISNPNEYVDNVEKNIPENKIGTIKVRNIESLLEPQSTLIRVKSMGSLLKPKLGNENADTDPSIAIDVQTDVANPSTVDELVHINKVVPVSDRTGISDNNEVRSKSTHENQPGSGKDATFADRFHTTYRYHFDKSVESKIPKLGELLHLAIADLVRTNERIKRAEQLSSSELISEEKQMADKCFNQMMKVRGIEFTPLCATIINQFETSSKLSLFLILFYRIMKHAELIDPLNENCISEARIVAHAMLTRIPSFQHKEIVDVLHVNFESFSQKLERIKNLIESHSINDQNNSTGTQIEGQHIEVSNQLQEDASPQQLSTASGLSTEHHTSDRNKNVTVQPEQTINQPQHTHLPPTPTQNNENPIQSRTVITVHQQSTPQQAITLNQHSKGQQHNTKVHRQYITNQYQHTLTHNQPITTRHTVIKQNRNHTINYHPTIADQQLQVLTKNKQSNAITNQHQQVKISNQYFTNTLRYTTPQQMNQQPTSHNQHVRNQQQTRHLYSTSTVKQSQDQHQQQPITVNQRVQMPNKRRRTTIEQEAIAQRQRPMTHHGILINQPQQGNTNNLLLATKMHGQVTTGRSFTSDIPNNSINVGAKIVQHSSNLNPIFRFSRLPSTTIPHFEQIIKKQLKKNILSSMNVISNTRPTSTYHSPEPNTPHNSQWNKTGNKANARPNLSQIITQLEQVITPLSLPLIRPTTTVNNTIAANSNNLCPQNSSNLPQEYLIRKSQNPTPTSSSFLQTNVYLGRSINNNPVTHFNPKTVKEMNQYNMNPKQNKLQSPSSNQNCENRITPNPVNVNPEDHSSDYSRFQGCSQPNEFISVRNPNLPPNQATTSQANPTLQYSAVVSTSSVLQANQSQSLVPSTSHCHPFIIRRPISGKMRMLFDNSNND